jgi:hypothetical protein
VGKLLAGLGEAWHSTWKWGATPIKLPESMKKLIAQARAAWTGAQPKGSGSQAEKPAGFWSRAGDYIRRVLTGLPGLAERIGSGVATALQKAPEALRAAWDAFWAWADGQLIKWHLRWIDLSGGLRAIPDGLRSAWDRFWSWVDKMLITLELKAIKLQEAMVESLAAIPDALQRAWDGFWTWLEDKAQKALGPLKKISGQVSEWLGLDEPAQEPGRPAGSRKAAPARPEPRLKRLTPKPSPALDRIKRGMTIQIEDGRKAIGRMPPPPPPPPGSQSKLDIEIRAPRGWAQIMGLEKKGDDGLDISAGVEEMAWAT